CVRLRASAGHFDDSGERHTYACIPPLADNRSVKTKRTSQCVPCLRYWFRGKTHLLKHRAGRAAEVREIQPENAEESRPARFDAFELIVPILAACQKAVHHAHDAETAELASTVHSVASAGAFGPDPRL